MAQRSYFRLSTIALYTCLSVILLVASLVSAATSRTKREMEDLAFREATGGPAISIPVVESRFSRRQTANLTCPSGQQQCVNVCIDIGLSCCPSLKAYCFKGGDFCCSKEMCCGLGEVCVGGPFNSTCQPIPVEPKFNSSCSGNAQCPTGLFCTNGKCGCPSTKVPCNNNTKCCPALTFGQSCTDATECMNLLQCTQGTCSCPTSVSFACEGNTTCCTTNTLSSSVVIGSAVPTATAGTNSGAPGHSVDSSGEQKSSLPLGAILGATAAVLLCTIAVAAYFMARRRRQQSENAEIKVLRKVKKVGTDGTIYEEVVTTTLNGDNRLSSASTLQGDDGVAPHWLFSRLAGPTRMSLRSVPYEGPICAVVKGYNPESDDELALDPGHLVELKHIFRDGWGVGVNLDTGMYGAIPLTALEFAGHMLPTAPSTMPANAQGVSRRMESSSWALSPSMTAGAQNIVSRRVSVPVTSSMLAIIASGKPNGECPPPQHSKSDTVISGRTATQPSSTSSATTFMTTPLSASIVSVYSAGVLPRPVPVATRDTTESSDGNGMDVRGPFTSPPGSGPQF